MTVTTDVARGEPSVPGRARALPGSLADLGDLLAERGWARPFAVLSVEALKATPLADADLQNALADRTHEEFTRFTPNPKSQEAAEAARAAARMQADCVIAVGGGSCMDIGKVAALAARTPHLIDELTQGRGTHRARPLPIVAVPTTAGTGSDATHFAAIYVDGKKVSVGHPKMLPAKVILDARFHEKMPAKLAASTGLDALAQALESIWAVGASSESVAYATDAGRVIVRHLVPSVIEGRVDSRRRMMQAAHEAGRAINISKTTASHALSYAMTTFFGLPHGLAVALTLGELTAFNAGVTSADCLDPRGPDVVQSRVRRAAALLGATPGTLGDALRGLLRQLGVPATLEEAGVPERALDELAGAVDAVRLTNNPRRATHDELVGLLRRSWRPT